MGPWGSEQAAIVWQCPVKEETPEYDFGSLWGHRSSNLHLALFSSILRSAWKLAIQSCDPPLWNLKQVISPKASWFATMDLRFRPEVDASGRFCEHKGKSEVVQHGGKSRDRKWPT